MRRFYIPPDQLQVPDPFLQGDEAKHILQILRMKKGDRLLLFDNSHQEYQAVIVSVSGDRVYFEISDRQVTMRESPLQVTLGLPIIRPQHFEWILQKGTELGVYAFFPFYSAHSRLNFEKADLESRMKRWKKIIVEAAKQCQRNVLPELFPAVPFTGLLEESRQTLKLIPYEEESSRTLKELEQQSFSSGTALALIGPEGGFHKKEVGQAREKGFVPISLGPRILRSETAALALVCLLQFLWGDMGSVNNRSPKDHPAQGRDSRGEATA
ncbi:MAG: 16S rRNA (uracil(1498)-N(3))-methyltransferase [Deltaproteobacteria bacterium]|nr:16S rRNA (uracil(1498)-N(3))-methyltransferase [Deltaproteobacteria bacterium]